MESAVVLRIVIFFAGIILLGASVYSLSRRRMTEPFCLAWGFVALMIMIAGLLMRPSDWRRYIGGSTLVIVLLVGFCVGWGAFFISCKISELMRKNLELAMQVTLLNHENEEIRKELEIIRESISENEKNIICDQHSGKSRSGSSADGAVKTADCDEGCSREQLL